MKRSPLNPISKKKCKKNMIEIANRTHSMEYCDIDCRDCEHPRFVNHKPQKPINLISKKKAQEIKDEQPIRKQLWERCKGLCEHCGQPPDWRGLHPHEKKFRSHGGCLTMENSEMWCGRCHAVDGHNLREAKDA